MNKIFLAVMLFVMPAVAMAADIAGVWTINGDVAGNAVNLKCMIEKGEAGAFTGKCSGERGSMPTSGKVAGDQVTFALSMDNGQVWELNYSGAFDKSGDSVKGEIVVGRLSGPFLAVRDSASKVGAPDVAGIWKITGDVAGNAIDMKCLFKVDEAKLLGTCTYAGLGDSDTTGTVAGNRVTFSNQVMREQLYVLTYSGALDAAGGAMKGDVVVAGVVGEFSGARQK